MERDRRRPRIFLGPIEIAGFFSGLQTGFREIGERADLYDITGDPFRYRRHGAVATGRAVSGGSALADLFGRLTRGIARFVVFFRVIGRYDTFVIGGTGFWNGRELAILRALGKRVIWVFLGTDHRPPYLSGKFVGRGVGPRELGAMTRRTASRIRRVERWAHAVVAHEASAQFHRQPFVRLLEIGLPMAVEGGLAEGRASMDAERPLRILHCPTDPIAKASASIREAVDAVRSSGQPVDYREIVGRPHREVLDAIVTSDLVIDELYGDTPLGVLAAEAAWFGIPTVCGGYFAPLCRPLSDGTPFPAGFVVPDEFQETVRRLAEDPDERQRRGRSGETFVRSRWTAAEVASRMRSVVRGEIPDGWMVDPASVTYVDGYGISRAARVAAVRALVADQGEDSLALRDRPDLVRALTSD